MDEAAVTAREQGMRIGEFLVQSHKITEKDLFEALAEQFSLEFIPQIENLISTDLIRELPLELFKSGKCFPLSSSDTTLKIVVSDPFDLDIVQAD